MNLNNCISFDNNKRHQPIINFFTIKIYIKYKRFNHLDTM